MCTCIVGCTLVWGGVSEAWGEIGRESGFSHRKPPTLLPDYGTWMECMGTLGTTELHEEASRQLKGKSRRCNLNMQEWR